MSDTVFFHEDYYRQVELVPEQNYFKTLKDIEDLPSKEDTTNGFDNIIIRQEHTIKTSDLNIQTSKVQDALLPISINYFPKVNTGYGNHVQLKKNTIAFGFERLGIFVEFNSEVVTNVWLCQAPSFTNSKNGEKLIHALYTLGSTFKLVLVDWDEEAVIRISNLSSLKNYLTSVYGFMIPEK